MDRLTLRDENGKAWAELDAFANTERQMEFGRLALNRLAAYEDSGLEPEEIETLKREYLKICPKPKSCPFLRVFSHGQGCLCGLEPKGEKKHGN